MPDPTKPGSDDGNAGTPVAAPPTEAAQPTAPPQDPSTTPAQPQAQDVQQTLEPPPATPEEFQARLEVERKKVLDEYRAKAGAEGGWMRLITEEDRELLKTKPWLLREMQAKIEAYDKILPSLGQKQDSQKQETGPDPLVEGMKAEMLQVAKNEDPEVYFDGLAKVLAKYIRTGSEEVHRQNFQPSHEKMTRQQEEAVVVADPRWQDPRVQKHVLGTIQWSHGKVMPVAAFKEACDAFGLSNGNGNGHAQAAPVQPRVTPAFGETRTVSQPQATPSLSLAERFARTPSGRWLDGKT